MNEHKPLIYVERILSTQGRIIGFRVHYKVTLDKTKKEYIQKFDVQGPVLGNQMRTFIIVVKPNLTSGEPEEGAKDFMIKNPANPANIFEIDANSDETKMQVKVVIDDGGVDEKGKSTVTYGDAD